jgi:hypothetical protein
MFFGCVPARDLANNLVETSAGGKTCYCDRGTPYSRIEFGIPVWSLLKPHTLMIGTDVIFVSTLKYLTSKQGQFG